MTPDQRAAGPGLLNPGPEVRRLVPPQLTRAHASRLAGCYEHASYEITGPDGETEWQARGLGVPGSVEPVDRWLASVHCASAVVLTACQPFSSGVSEEEDGRRHATLGLLVAASGLRWRRARSSDPAGLWPVEPGFALLDCPAGWVPGLLEAWSQWAVLWLDGHGARLQWHAAWPSRLRP